MTVGWLTFGGALGGAVLGASAAAVGSATRGWAPSTRLVVLAAVLLMAGVWDITGLRFPGRRQVDETWLDSYRSWVYGAGYGIQFGLGFVTVVNTALVPATVVSAVLVTSPAVAVGIGVTFGAVRGLTVMATGRVRSPADLMGLHRRLDGHDDDARRAGAVAAAALGLLAIVAIGA